MKNVFSELLNGIAPDLLNKTSIRINGNGELIMSGCMRINEYGEDRAEFSASEFDVRVSGKALKLTVLSERTVALKGTVLTVELVDKK